MSQTTKMTNKLFSLQHIEKMTDSVGMLEHCTFTEVNYSEGYATDDNARALQVMLRLGALQPADYIEKYSTIYLGFLLSAETENGFRQDMNASQSWKGEGSVEEGFGRAMAALSEASISAITEKQRAAATQAFDEHLSLIKKVKHPRTIAQIIIALSYRKNTELIRLADELAALYSAHSSDSWCWYEDEMTYDNGRLPLGMFHAYQSTGNKKYLQIALESLDFLLAQTFDEKKKCFSFVGNTGWFQKKGKKALFDQQPVEAGSTVEVCVLAFKVTKMQKYLEYAKKALEWYSGRNIVGLSLLNPVTGGVKDGLEEHSVNQNEGAEAVLSYVLACLALQKII